MTVWGKKREYVYQPTVDVSELSYDYMTVSRIDREEMISYVEMSLKHGWELDGDSYLDTTWSFAEAENVVVHSQGIKRRKRALWV